MDAAFQVCINFACSLLSPQSFFLLHHPGSCVGDDAVKVLRENAYCYQGYTTVYNDLMFGGMLNVTDICEPLERDFDSPGFSIVIIIFLIFLICVISASIRTQHLAEMKAKYSDIYKLHQDSNPNQPNAYDNHWFLQCFSIQNLWKQFTKKRPKSKSQFNFLDGIRVYSMSWVIYGHIWIFYLFSSPSNQAVLMPFTPDAKPYPYVFTKFYMMLAEYAFYSVDSFFFLSGFLGAFSMHRVLKTYGKKAIKMSYIWIPLSYMNRFLRIFPMMAFVLLINWFIVDQLPYGYNVTSRTANAELCSESWYKVFFFYANLEADQDDLGCMGHLWYIQCDMQMFLFLPFIIFVL